MFLLLFLLLKTTDAELDGDLKSCPDVEYLGEEVFVHENRFDDYALEPKEEPIKEAYNWLKENKFPRGIRGIAYYEKDGENHTCFTCLSGNGWFLPGTPDVNCQCGSETECLKGEPEFPIKFVSERTTKGKWVCDDGIHPTFFSLECESGYNHFSSSGECAQGLFYIFVFFLSIEFNYLIMSLSFFFFFYPEDSTGFWIMYFGIGLIVLLSLLLAYLERNIATEDKIY